MTSAELSHETFDRNTTTLHDMRRGPRSLAEPSIHATQTTRKCHESSKSAQARTDFTCNDAHSEGKHASPAGGGRQKTPTEEAEE